MRLFQGLALLLPLLAACGSSSPGEAASSRELARSEARLTGGVGPPVLLQDLRAGELPPRYRGFGRVSGTAGGKVYFQYTDDNGAEPWVTDGTPEGTSPLGDILPGPGGSSVGVGVPFGSRMMLLLNDGVHGTEWWLSDGTVEGTRLVKDSVGGPEYGATSQAVVMNGVFYFIANNGSSAWELWRSDGTRDGTWRLGESLYGQYNRHEVKALVALGDTLYFGSSNRLYRSDGTVEGTRLVYEVDASAHTLELHPFILGGRLYFSAGYDSLRALWTSDGTAAGTFRLDSDYEAIVGEDGDRVFYETTSGSNSSWYHDLYVTRGVPGSTTFLRSVSSTSPGTFARVFGKVGSHLLFAWHDSTQGSELWRTDGTRAGTVLVKDLIPGSVSSAPRSGVLFGGAVYFLADTATGSALWRTDGTADGTVEVRSFGVKLPPVADLRTVGSRLVFFADDGVTGAEPWVSDGTAEGTLPLGDLNPGAAGSAPGEPRGVGARLLFVATVGGARELWATDGTVEGTRKVRPVNKEEGCLCPSLDGLGHAFFTDFEGGRLKLWRADGSVSEPPPLLVGPSHNGDSNPSDLIVSGGVAYFVPDLDIPLTNPIYRTDGTPAGTRAVISLPYASWDGQPERLTPFNGKLWFRYGSDLYAGDPETGTATYVQMPQDLDDFKPVGTRMVGLWWESPYLEVWTHTGTATGSTRVEPLRAEPSAYRDLLFPVGSSLMFPLLNPATGRWDLMRTNGTAAGTVRTTHHPERPRDFTSTGSLGFYGNGGTLWRTNGIATAAGTHALTATQGREPEDLKAAGELLFFTAREDGTGREPWVTDGTQEGTHRIADFQPGEGSSVLLAARSHHGASYLLLQNWEGRYLVRTDGTEAGTVKLAAAPGATWLGAHGGALLLDAADPVAGQEPRAYLPGARALTLLGDVNPGLRGSAPGMPVLVGNRLVFVATKADEGREPFAMEVDTTPPSVSQVLDGTLGSGGFYRSDVSVRFTVTDEESGTALTTTGCEPVTVVADTPGQTLTCTAYSLGGVTTQAVTVRRDATPPTVSCPGDLVVTQGATPAYGVTAADAFDSSPTVRITPATVLPAGSHVVRAEATDDAGNSATCQFQVTVLARGGADAGTDGGSGTDAGDGADAGGSPDAGGTPDAGSGTDGGTLGGGEPPPSDGDGDDGSGCGCSGSGVPSSTPWLLMALALFSWRGASRTRRCEVRGVPVRRP